mgnify:CR=1 FL=1
MFRTRWLFHCPNIPTLIGPLLSTHWIMTTGVVVKGVGNVTTSWGGGVNKLSSWTRLTKQLPQKKTAQSACKILVYNLNIILIYQIAIILQTQYGNSKYCQIGMKIHFYTLVYEVVTFFSTFRTTVIDIIRLQKRMYPLFNSIVI